MNERKGRSNTCLFLYEKTIDKSSTGCYNIGVIKRGKPQKERKIKNERIWVNELGYFSKETVENIKKNLDGATYMNFKVIYSNCCGNYTLGICTDSEESEQEIKNCFLACALTHLSLLVR